MLTFVFGMVSAFIFALEFFDVKMNGYSINVLALFFLALAVAFIPAWPWIRSRVQ